MALKSHNFVFIVRIMALKSHSKYKMADFLLGLGYTPKRLLFKSWDDTSIYQISSIYVKFKEGASTLKWLL